MREAIDFNCSWEVHRVLYKFGYIPALCAQAGIAFTLAKLERSGAISLTSDE